MKHILTFALCLALMTSVLSCGRAAEQPGSLPPAAEPTQTEAGRSGPHDLASYIAGAAKPRTEKIKTVKYPPRSLPSFVDLTDDQKAAYDTYAAALEEILENGPDAVIGKVFSLPHSISVTDMCTAKYLLSTNFDSTTGSLISCLTYKHSEDAQDRADSIFLYDYGHLDEYYRDYLEASAAADDILSSLAYDGTEYDKALAIAEWVVDNVEYALDYDGEPDSTKGDILDALIGRKAVCAGYAKAYDFLCKKAGLETLYVTNRDITHAWNMIHIGNDWYHIDTTWMDSGSFLDNFMMSDADFEQQHGRAEYFWDFYHEADYTPCADGSLYEVREFWESKGLLFPDAEAALEFIGSLDGGAEEFCIWIDTPDGAESLAEYDHTYIKGQKKYLGVAAKSAHAAYVYFT